MEMTISKMFEKGSRLYTTMQKAIDDDVFQALNNKSILITGGTGFIIRYFIYMIICRNDKCDSKIKMYVMVRNLEKAKLIYGDLYNRDDLNFVQQDVCEKITLEKKVDYIIHSAGQSNPVMIQADPVGTFNANIIGTNNVLEYAHNNNVEAVLYMSSYMVYGGAINVDNVDNPHIVPIDFQNYKNCYGQSKRSGEMLCACYHEQYGVDTKIIRPSFIYGASDDSDKRVWSEIIRNVANDEDVVLNSDGVVLRSVSYVIDVVRAMLYIMLKGEAGVGYNVESDITTIREFAQMATQYEGTKSKLIFKNESDNIIDESRLKVPETMQYKDKLRLYELGWKPLMTIEEAIANSIEIEKDKH